MKLTHLGASYTPSTQAIDTVETNTELSFLGRRFKMRTAQSTPQGTANRIAVLATTLKRKASFKYSIFLNDQRPLEEMSGDFCVFQTN